MTEPAHNPAQAFEPENSADDERLDGLAALPRFEYAKRRKAESKALGVSVRDLDREVSRRRPHGDNDILRLPEIELWPEFVDGEALLDDVVASFRRYIVLPDHAVEAIALWCQHTHCLNAAQITPRLNLKSPEKRCAKTSTLMVIGRLVPRPLHAANISPSAVFRAIEAHKPTLLLDEADTYLRDTDNPLRGILNSGHFRETAYVVRTVGDNHESALFSTWGAVAISGIGKLPETLDDRSITIPLRRKRKDERVERLRIDRLDAEAVLARKLARWAHDNRTAVADADPRVPDDLNDRQADNWRPLLSVADQIGGRWPKVARAAASALSNDDEDRSSIGEMVLDDIRAIFNDSSEPVIFSAELCTALAAREDRPWPEYGKSRKPITTRQLASLLGRYGIRPSSQRIQDRTAKGYSLDKFEDAWGRYLGDLSVTTSQPAETLDFSAIPKRHTESVVTDGKPQKMADSLTCDVVTDGNPENGGASSFSDDDDIERQAIQEIDGGLLDAPEIPDFLRRHK